MVKDNHAYNVAHLIAGESILEVGSRLFVVRNPSRTDRLRAELLYNDMYRKAISDGVCADAELMEYLEENHLWDDPRQKDLDTLTENIEKIKIGLFQNIFNESVIKQGRVALTREKTRHAELYRERHAHDWLTAEYIAESAKFKFLVGCSTFDVMGAPLWNNFGYEQPDYYINEITNKLLSGKLSDEVLRALARSTDWQTYWSISRNSNIFGVDVVDLSDEQRSLLSWSTFYDNIREHPECPTEAILNDDDVLDGWLALQRQKRENDRAKADIEARLAGSKTGEADEVYIMASSMKDAKAIGSLNDGKAQHTKRRRMKQLRDAGQVHEVQMCDVKERIAMEYNKHFADRVKNR